MNQLFFRPIGLMLVSFILALALPVPALAAPEKGPTEVLKQWNKNLEQVLRTSPAKDSPEVKKQQEEIKAGVAQLLDYPELAKRSLAQHWDTLKPQQRDTFSATFQEMLEKHYVKQVRSNLNYEVVYLEEKVTGDDAKVKTLIKIKEKDKTRNLDTEIEYKLHKVGAKWMVWDIITDEVSLVRNYKTQFNKLIVEQGYDKLLDKMKSKLKDNN